MKKCLIMGAGGFLGKKLCKKLINNYKVKAFDRYIPQELLDISNKIECITGDFASIVDFSDLLTDIDIVFHLISTTVPRDDSEHIDIEIVENVVPTVRLLENMVKNKVKDIIFFSSGGTVYGETRGHYSIETDHLHPICSYGVQKKVIESYLELYGSLYDINYKILRISNPYGIGQDSLKPQGIIPIFIQRLLSEEEITIYGDGNNERDYIYSEDLMGAMIKVVEYKGNEHVFNIASGENYTINQIVKIIEELTDKRFVKVNYQQSRRCDIRQNRLNNRLAAKELGWEAKTNVKKGILEILRYYEGN